MENISESVCELIQKSKKITFPYTKKEIVAFMLQCVDFTTLEGTDTEASVARLCEQAKAYNPQPAAVCVYPVFCRVTKQQLLGSEIKTASVAGAFPSGQSPIEIKLAEVRYALENGADEIDMVISRGKFLEKEYNFVFDEIAAIKQICSEKCLKVILETGELKTAENIYKASQIAISAGADFVKTSTGKIQTGATFEAFAAILLAVKESQKNIGVKVSGGVSDIETASFYVKLLYDTLGEKWLNPNLFRIGTSRLADKFNELLNG